MTRSLHGRVGQVRMLAACTLLMLWAVSFLWSSPAVSETSSTAQVAEIAADFPNRTKWRGATERTETSDVVPASHGLSAFIQNGRTGTISASPNPIVVCDGSGLGTTTLTWSSTGTKLVEVRVGSPAGTLFAQTGSDGTGTTGKWVGNGTVFYLQDVSAGLPLTSANTLATVKVVVTSTGCATPTPTPTPTPPLYEGFHDGADCTHIFGWAADRNRLNTSINVDIYDGATLLTSVLADGSRPDVGSYLGDDGLHGFDIPVPANLKDGQPHSITVKFGGTSLNLGNTPRSITCLSCLAPIAPAPSSLPPDYVWVEDQTPTAATLAGNWVWGTNQRVSGSQSHTEPVLSGVHQHYFYGATQPLAINAGDRLVTYVLLNPCSPPQEIMLQWYDASGSWEHRAFWGADLIGWGLGGTASRFPMGELPQTGVWVRLEVPASAVGLEGSTINGMAFTLYDGQAWFDRAGKLARLGPVSATASNNASGSSPTQAVDGNPGTAWNAGGFPPQWIQLDLGQPATVSQVRLKVNQLPDGHTTHEIYGGSDPQALTLIGTLSGFTQAGQWLDANFAPAVDNIRYLKILTTVSASWVSWYEIEVYGSFDPTDLVGHWKFDEGVGLFTADSSGNNNNATLQNGPVWTTGKINTGLGFDGVDDYAQVGAGSGLSMTNALTIAAWVNRTGDGIIVNKEGEYEVAVLAGRIQWAFANSNPGWAWIDTGYTAPLNQWTHIAGTYDNGTLKTYANGVLVHTYAGAGAIGDVDPVNNDLRIGGRQCCAQYFQGKLDEVRIYNRALGVEEIQSLVGPANQSPVVSLTTPANGATFIAPATITITANATDADGSISRVDFFADATLLGTDTTVPYSFTWINVANGSYSLTGRATDNYGATTTSTAVSITVDEPPLYEGAHDGADCARIFGWAADRNRLNTSVSVDIYDSAALLTTVTANQHRADIGAYLGDNGLHGFDFAVPQSLKDGQLHSITVSISGTGYNLSGTPKSITCTAEDPEAIRQRVLQQMQVQYDAAIAAAHAQNAAIFNSTYEAYPEVPRGVLEAISYLHTDFQREQPVVDADGQMPVRRTYGILGLTVDDSGYFRSNLNLVAQLSGYPVDQIKQDSAAQLLAFAQAYVSIKHNLGITSSDPVDHLPILDALGDVPDVDNSDVAYARERYLYEILFVLNQSNYQTMFRSPRYEVNLEQVFGSASYQLLSSPYVEKGSQTEEATPAAACRTPNGLGVEHVQQTTSPILWKPRSEAVSYNVRYKKVADPDWQTFNVVPSNPQPNPVMSQLSNLTPATKYEFQVQSVCSPASVQPPVVSSFSTSFTFFTFNAGPICLEQGVNGCNFPNMQWDGNGSHLSRLQDVDLDGNGMGEELTDLRACNWISSIVIHTTEGDHNPQDPNARYVSTIAGWKKPASGNDQGAGHYLVSKVDGQIYKAFDERLMVTHTFKNHSYSVGIEHTGIARVGGFSPAMYDQSAKLVKAIACRYGIDTRFMYAGPATGYLGAKYELPFFQVTPLINLPDPENHRTYVSILGHGHTPKHGTHYDPGIHWNWFGYYQLVNADVIRLPFPTPTSATTLTQCTGKLADDGGPSGNYSNSARRRWVIKPGCLQPNSKIKLSFSDFSTAPGDWMYVYDGEITYDQAGNPQGHLIGAWSNWASPNNAQSGGHYYASQNNVDWGVHLTNPQSYKSPQKFFKTYAGATNGAITIELIADSFGHERGFTATWSVETPTTTAAVQEECPLTCCVIPLNLDVIDLTSSTARIVWNPTGADHYNVRFRIVGEGDNQWRVRNSADADRTLTGLERLTDYEVQVQSVCGTETSPDWSYSEFFTTRNCADPPVGLRLVRAETDKLTVAWDSTGASEFKVEWKISGRPDSEFDSQIVQGTSFEITKWRSEATLRACTDYVVQVRSVCPTGNSPDIDASYRTSCPEDPPSGSCGLIKHCKGDPFRILIEQSRNQFGQRHFTAKWATRDKRNPRVWRARYRECVHFPFDPPGVYTCLPFFHVVPPPGRGKHKPKCADNKHWDYVLEDFPIDLATILLDFQISCDGGSTWYKEERMLNDPGVTVSNITASSANVSWQPVPNATGYVVTYGQAEAEEAITISTQSTSVLLSGLVTNQEYDVEILSLLPEGNARTPLAKFVTAAPGTCAVPQDLIAYDMTSNGAALSWELAPGAVGYYVRYAVAGTSNWTDFYSIGNHANLTGLSSGTTYKFKVQSVCAGEMASGYSGKANLTTAGAPMAGYCAAAGSRSAYEWIDNVTLSNLNNTSGQDGGFGEYTNLSINLTAGGTYPVTLTPGFTPEAGPFVEYWRMWIDFNANGSFSDPGELVLSPDAASTVVNGSIVVPTSAIIGTTRMRVAMKFAGYPPDCGDIEDGEVEDYSVNITAPTPPQQTPFNGPHNIPGITQAEDFDNGGEGVAYHDHDTVNDWGFYRTNVGVDIAPDGGASGGAIVANARQGEWLEYTINVTAAGDYNLVARIASGGPGGKFHYVIDPDSASPIVTPQLIAPNTGWSVYTDAPAMRVFLSAGTHILRIALDENGSQQFPAIADFDYLNITPFTPAPTVPGNLIATSVSSSQINLNWTSSINHTGYILERSLTSGSGFVPIATLGTTATSYPDTGLVASTTYYYRIKSINGAEQSAYSNVGFAATAGAPPAAPGNLGASAVSNSLISLGWTDNSNNENGFVLERSTDAVNFAVIGNPIANQIAWNDPNLAASTTYYYRLKAVNSFGSSTYSNIAQATTFATSPPAAPGALAATAFSSSQINLTWQDNSSNENNFVVERNDGSGWVELVWLGANVTTYQNVGLPASRTYSYRVKASNTGGFSTYSNIATATTLSGSNIPNAPTNLTAAVVSSSRIDLNWQDNSDNEWSFMLERDSGAGFVQIQTLAPNTIAYSDTNLASGQTYSYRVRAYNSSGIYSPYSNVAQATTISYFSLALNGSQWFEAPSTPTIDVNSSSLTVEAWIRTNADYLTCTICPVQEIVSRITPNVTSGVDGGYRLWINSSGKLKFATYRNSTHFGVVTSSSSFSVIPITPGEWHHVAGVYNSIDGMLSVYVDGVRTGSALAEYGPRTGTAPLIIGRSNDPNNPQWFQGKIDEVRISVEAVYTGATITNYQSLAHLLPRPTGTTRALWKFDAQSGADTSGNNNTGMALGGAGYSPDVPDFGIAASFERGRSRTFDSFLWTGFSFNRFALLAAFPWRGGSLKDGKTHKLPDISRSPPLAGQDDLTITCSAF